VLLCISAICLANKEYHYYKTSIHSMIYLHCTVLTRITHRKSRLIYTVFVNNFGKIWNDFQNSFTRFVTKFSMYIPRKFPRHLQYVATLPCEIRKSKNVTNFDSIRNKLLTNQLVKEFRKSVQIFQNSVRICQSYYQTSSGLLSETVFPCTGLWHSSGGSLLMPDTTQERSWLTKQRRR